MIAAFDIFGQNAFRKISAKSSKKYPVNKALFESWSVNLAILNHEELRNLKEEKQELINHFIFYVDNDKEFLASISQANTRVEYRFKIIEKIIQQTLS